VLDTTTRTRYNDVGHDKCRVVKGNLTMPRRASERPAAYTRTRHLDRFLDQVATTLPPVVDIDFVKRKLELSGGDVRAFLQSLRVLGLIDALGRPTERLRQARGRERRAHALREGLREAYPELDARRDAEGPLSREQVEDHFKVVYGLGATSAAPAAKLFLDLWVRAGGGAGGASVVEAASKGGEVRGGRSPAAERGLPREAGDRQKLEATDLGKGTDIARLLAGLVHVEIGRDWDAERINLVFDRLERLIDRLTVDG
jgi:hypothetical protein